LYSLHSNGPYSSRLDYSIDNLELMGAIRISQTKSGYRILPGDSAEALVEKGRDLIGKYRERIDYLLERLPENAMELELWATVCYVADVQKGIYGSL
jgi:hypothetical protein